MSVSEQLKQGHLEICHDADIRSGYTACALSPAFAGLEVRLIHDGIRSAESDEASRANIDSRIQRTMAFMTRLLEQLCCRSKQVR